VDRSDKVNHEQINTVFMIIASFSGNLSHHHHLFLFKIISKVGDVVSMLSKGIPEEESDWLCLLPDWVKIEFYIFSKLLNLSSHVLQFDHFIHLFLLKKFVFIGLLHSQFMAILLDLASLLDLLFNVSNLVVNTGLVGLVYFSFFDFLKLS